MPGALSFEYADVSADPVASFWAEVPLDVKRTLDRLEFERVGYAHGHLAQCQVHLVHEIRVSPDGLVQSVAGRGPPDVEFASLLADGTVLKSIPRPPPLIWLNMAPGMRHQARDRHLLFAIDAPIEEVLADHRHRLEALVEERGSPAVPLDSMAAHFAVRLRSAELRDARIPSHLWFAYIGAMLTMMASVVGLAGYLKSLGALKSNWSVVLCILAGLIVYVPAHRVILWQIAPRLARLLPAPPPSDAVALMARGRQVPVRALPDCEEE